LAEWKKLALMKKPSFSEAFLVKEELKVGAGEVGAGEVGAGEELKVGAGEELKVGAGEEKKPGSQKFEGGE
jgi:hypothetical protein